MASISDSSEGSSRSEKSQAKPSTQRKGKRKAFQVAESDENDLFEKAVAVMNEKSDEFDVLGQYVASELRQMVDPSIRQIAKKQILQVLVNCMNANANEQPHSSVSSARHVQQTQNQRTRVNQCLNGDQIVEIANSPFFHDIEYDEVIYLEDENQFSEQYEII